MLKQSRRDFLKISGATVAGGTTLLATQSASAGTKKGVLKLGMASYTLREFDLDQTIEMTKRLGLKHIAFKSFHLPMDASKQECEKVAQKVKDAGLNLYGGGVIYMKDKAQVDQAFDYAKWAGMKVIIGVPNHELLSYVEKKVKEYDIILAIHNHGPGDKVYPSPQSAYELVKDMDKRMGLCMDIGHTQRIGIDPAKTFVDLQDRIFDIHIKDVSKADKDGTTVEVGRGVIDIPGFLKTLVKKKYDGIVSLEYEKDGKDPLPGAAESIGYVKGVLATL